MQRLVKSLPYILLVAAFISVAGAESNPALDPGSGMSAGDTVKSAKGEFGFSQFWFYLKNWFPEGITHILVFSAADHLLFVIGLTLTMLGLRALIFVITFFTISHGLSLAVVAFGEFDLSGGVVLFVELGIAATIFWIGFENIKMKGQVKHRYVWAFVFGLIHGLGFAKDMLDKFLTIKPLGEEFTSATIGKYIAAILGFNLGVDFGQIVIAAVAFLTLKKMAEIGSWNERDQSLVYTGGSLIIAFFGAGMFIERVIVALFA